MVNPYVFPFLYTEPSYPLPFYEEPINFGMGIPLDNDLKLPPIQTERTPIKTIEPKKEEKKEEEEKS